LDAHEGVDFDSQGVRVAVRIARNLNTGELGTLGLLGDIEELQEFWPNLLWWGKCAVVLMLFLTTGSVTSLSETVFQWRGFILDGMEFYRQWITAPLREIARDLVGLRYTGVQVDIVVLFGLGMGSFARWARYTAYSGIPVIIMAVISIILLGTSSFGVLVAYVFIFGFVFTYIVFAIMAFHGGAEQRIAFFGPPLFAVAVVLVLGAINAGLTQPL